jgi:hypothetical protein
LEQLIDFHAPEVQAVLDTLLKDKSTGKNIIWATDPPEELQTVMYEPVTDRSQITTQQLGLTHYEVVLPRMMKQTDTQQQRTRKKGEVFSPAWVCNKMNNALDADWFRGLGAEENAGQFTVELPQGWQTVETPVQFPVCKGRTPAWVQYVQSRRLEVTCGEAPFLASRYDAATGEMIPVARRIGILDRKLRVVGENAATEDEWRKYATHAVQSTYGYEYQGDNLLLARVNLLLTYAEHLQARWQRKPTKEELQPIANIISWNLWQMDGLRLSVPGGKPQPEAEQLDLFSMFGAAESQLPTVSCKVKNWRKGSHGTAQNFETIQEGSTSMKFDYVIGNPPYQEETVEEVSKKNGQAPRKNIFHYFQMAADQVARRGTDLIYPAGRWIHRSGKGMENFGLEQINDPHLKKLIFYPKSRELFDGVDIADGVGIVIKDMTKQTMGFEYVYTSEQKCICVKVKNPGTELMPLDPRNMVITEKVKSVVEKYKLNYLHDRILPRSLFGIESNFIEENPEKAVLLETVDNIDYSKQIKLFTNDKAGKAGRAKWYVVDKNVVENNPEYISQWKVVVSSANAGGQKRDSQLEIVDNHSAFGRARVALASFKTQDEANNFYNFARSYVVRFTFLMTDESLTALGKRVPDLMDYTNKNSLVDFSEPLDEQLYLLFELNSDEIEYIESTINNLRKKKEMA